MANLGGTDVVIGGIAYTLDLDDKQFKEGLNAAGKNIKSFGESTEGHFSAVTSASQVFGKTLLGIGVAIGTAGVFAIKSAGDMEMLRTSLDTLTGSTEQGSKLFKDLYDFAAKTPFETTDLAKATQTMLSFGISNEKVMPYLKMLGDVSMGNKDKLQGLSLAFAQVQSTGRLMGQDLLQMVNQGFNPLTVISQKTGESMTDLKKKMEAGQISAEMVADAFKTATSEGGLFYKGMEKGSQTLQGIWSTLMDSVGMIVRGMVGLSETGEIVQGGLFDKVKNGISTLGNFLNDNKDKIIGAFKDMFQWVMDNGYLIGGALLGGILPGLIGVNGALWTAAAAVWAVLGPLLPFIAAGAAIGLIIKLLVDHFGGWAAVMQKLQPTFQVMHNIWANMILPGLQAIWNLIKTQLVPALQELWQKIEPVLLPVLKVIGIVLGVVIVGAIMAVIGIIWVIIQVITFLIDTFTNLWTNAVNVFNWLVEKVMWFKDNFWYAIGQVIGFFATLPVRLGMYVYEAIVGIINWLGSIDWGKVFSSIGNAFVAVWDAIKGAANSAWDYIKNIRWGEVLVNIGKGLGNAIIDLINGAIRGAFSGIPMLKDHIPQIPRFAEGINFVPYDMLAVIHQGEAVIPKKYNPSAGGNGGTVININAGNLIASDSELRAFTRKLQQAADEIFKLSGAPA